METKDVCFTNKQRAEADHAAGEETRKRACQGPRAAYAGRPRNRRAKQNLRPKKQPKWKRKRIRAPVQGTGRNVGNDHCYLTAFVYNVRQIKPISDIRLFSRIFFYGSTPKYSVIFP